MKLGFIGCGNMASALIGGVLKKNVVQASEVVSSDMNESARTAVQEAFGINVVADNEEVARSADVIVLAVKPQYLECVLSQIKDAVHESSVLLSIAPGKTLKWLEKKLGKPAKIVRSMPNTPALVGEGMTGVCCNEKVSKEELDQVCRVLSACGRVEVVGEELMDAVVAVSGSAPAYIYMVIEAMADAAVLEGMPRTQAYQFAAQAVLGSAKMVLDTGKHPGELKDMVCSPGGTTIEAVRVLEKKKLRSAVMEAMKACAEKSREM